VKKRIGSGWTSFTCLVCLAVAAPSARAQQVPLAPLTIPKFVNKLPLLSVAPESAVWPADWPRTLDTIVADEGEITLRMCEFESSILPPAMVLPGPNALPGNRTWTWGYVEGETCPTEKENYLGPVIVATRGVPTQIRFVNDLGTTASTSVVAWKTSTDQTLHWADPLNDGANACAMGGTMAAPGWSSGARCEDNYAGPIPAVPHLHGGEVPPVLDGGPDAWFTSDGAHHGAGYYTKPGSPADNSAVYRYPNTQEAGPLWFHDHTLGATRLNVYAGLAGAYVLADPAQDLAAGFPGPAEIIPLILQDRMFDAEGQLLFQAGAAGGILWALNPEHPFWSPEFVGDTVVVNGKAWPYLVVEPRRYRFLVLNGSNARTYELGFADEITGVGGPKMWVVANDGGYLDRPAIAQQKLVVMPGERYEVIVDFATSAFPSLFLKNVAKTPYPGGTTPQGGTMGYVMRVQIQPCATACDDTSYDPATLSPIRTPAMTRLFTGTGTFAKKPAVTRLLTLNEVMGMPPAGAVDPVLGLRYPGGPLEVLVNNTRWSGDSPRAYADFGAMLAGGASELPKEGDTEVWEIVNITADAHPIHLHLVQFQILNRQALDVAGYNAAYDAAFPEVEMPNGLSPEQQATWTETWGQMAAMCPGAVYCPGFGPPLHYEYTGAVQPTRTYAGTTGTVPVVGGNPDVTKFLKGKAAPPLPVEAGWKDTVRVMPGEVTRLVVRWAPTDAPAAAGAPIFPFDPAANGGGYVWHCHIIDHEDNEMMRPDYVVPVTGATRTYEQGTSY
jgi:FtsP/CotA-like multicopper oxidase with cupredoxin domain